MPLKILANFEPEQEFVLEPGDMLYLPPRYAHDGIAEGECMTYSIGFRSPSKGEVAQELLQRLAEQATDEVGEAIYQDPNQGAVIESALIPKAMVEFARDALAKAMQDPQSIPRAMGEYLTEPKANVWFDGDDQFVQGPVRLDRRTRMLFDEKHIFINGESFSASGKDARVMRALANNRQLPAKDVLSLSRAASELLAEWVHCGWAHADD
jgi:50S ribosomal protein L16 3-hydroxylase